MSRGVDGGGEALPKTSLVTAVTTLASDPALICGRPCPSTHTRHHACRGQIPILVQSDTNAVDLVKYFPPVIDWFRESGTKILVSCSNYKAEVHFTQYIFFSKSKQFSDFFSIFYV